MADDVARFLERLARDPSLLQEMRVSPSQVLRRERILRPNDRQLLLDASRSGLLDKALRAPQDVEHRPDARYPDGAPDGQFFKFSPTDIGIDTPRLYPHEPSVRADGVLQMHIASSASYVKLWFYRLTGKGLVAQYGELFSNPQPGRTLRLR